MTTLNALGLKNKLHIAPRKSPQYAKKVKNSVGVEVELGDPVVTRALVALMDMHAVIGGAASHWGGPASFAEIMSAVHGIMFASSSSWFEKYNFVNDAGHTENGIYALRANLGYGDLTFNRLKTFRSITSNLTGHGESHLYPDGVIISNGPLGSAFPQSQGLALADKLLGNDRVTICTISDGASMEGEAKEAFASIPGLAAKNKLNPYVLIISDNNTKLSGRIDKDSFDMNKTFQSLETLGWNLIKVPNGNDLQEVYLAVENAINEAKRDSSRPVALWCKTVKGFGVKATEASASGGHGFPLSIADDSLRQFVTEIFSNSVPEEFSRWVDELIQIQNKKTKSTESSPKVKSEKIQVGIANGMIKSKEAGYPVFSVTSDLQGSTGVAAFHKKFPNDFIDMGVSESNMVSVAGGLSKSGFIPVVDTFAQFGVTKGNLPLTMSIQSQAPMIAVFSHTGFQDAADGASHQATTYFSLMSSLPHTIVVACSCSMEAQNYMETAIKNLSADRKNGKDGESVIFFIGRENFPAYYKENLNYTWGEPLVLVEGTDGVIVTSGSLVPELLKAHEQLKTAGLNCTIVHNPFVNRPNSKIIGELIKKNKNRLVTVEDHQVIGGMGALLVHDLKMHQVEFSLKSLGINGEFGQSSYLASELYEKFGISANAVVNAMKELVALKK
ncbi:MAG: transketolase C-terminal domain-containing protein [Bacteriovoracaceae bacterium]